MENMRYKKQSIIYGYQYRYTYVHKSSAREHLKLNFLF